MSKKLNNLSKDQLEKEKLISEIKSYRRIWKQPSFWTFIAVIITASIGFYTGLFQAQKALIELENEKLNLKRDSLSLAIDSLEKHYNIIKQKYDSICIVSNKLQDEQDSIKKAYAIWKKTKQSKNELKIEVLDFVSSVRDLLNDFKTEDNLISNKRWWGYGNETPKPIMDSLWNVHTNEIITCSRKHINEYNNKYKITSIIYKEKLLTYLPNYKSKCDWVDYRHPTNRLGIMAITDDLEHMANKLE